MEGASFRAWGEGYKAGFYTPKAECPYGDDDPIAHKWLDGWSDGKRGRKRYLATNNLHSPRPERAAPVVEPVDEFADEAEADIDELTDEHVAVVGEDAA
jgi:ribosome modulation factor